MAATATALPRSLTKPHEIKFKLSPVEASADNAIFLFHVYTENICIDHGTGILGSSSGRTRTCEGHHAFFFNNFKF